ncbi:MAG: Holliday junction branch migration protein RuvA, partial [Alphaproteobacteria bacterium]|nr:Holliday junction branch migration protein RuvA [Alphaproteobacteria bacterium]
LSLGELSAAMISGDKVALGRASGVGPKLAQRIVAELKDKIGGIEFAAVEGGGVAPADGLDPALGDATSAVVNLGYGRAEAFGAVMEAARELGSDAKVETLIRTGLTRLGAAA